MPETRKLQEIGKTLYVSLPKRWTRKMQLKRGDAVTLIQQSDGSVIIYPEFKEESSMQIILVDAKESRQSLRRRITGAYVDGFDIIQLKAKEKLTEEQHNIVREITEDLFGLEVIEIASNLVTIQCLLTKTLPIERTVQRIHNIIKSMFSETISALKEREINLARGVAKRMRDVERLSLVTHRLLRSQILHPTERSREMSPIDQVDYLRALHGITEIAESVKKIAESVVLSEQAPPRSISEPMRETCAHVRNLYDWSIQALTSKDVSLANRVLDGKPGFENLWEFCVRAEENSEISSLTFSHAHRIIDNLKQVYAYAVEIAEIAIDRAEADIVHMEKT